MEIKRRCIDHYHTFKCPKCKSDINIWDDELERFLVKSDNRLIRHDKDGERKVSIEPYIAYRLVCPACEKEVEIENSDLTEMHIYESDNGRYEY